MLWDLLRIGVEEPKAIDDFDAKLYETIARLRKRMVYEALNSAMMAMRQNSMTQTL